MFYADGLNLEFSPSALKIASWFLVGKCVSGETLKLENINQERFFDSRLSQKPRQTGFEMLVGFFLFFCGFVCLVGFVWFFTYYFFISQLANISPAYNESFNLFT